MAVDAFSEVEAEVDVGPAGVCAVDVEGRSAGVVDVTAAVKGDVVLDNCVADRDVVADPVVAELGTRDD